MTGPRIDWKVAFGASRSLPSVPTKVRLLNRLPTLDRLSPYRRAPSETQHVDSALRYAFAEPNSIPPKTGPYLPRTVAPSGYSVYITAVSRAQNSGPQWAEKQAFYWSGARLPVHPRKGIRFWASFRGLRSSPITRRLRGGYGTAAALACEMIRSASSWSNSRCLTKRLASINALRSSVSDRARRATATPR